MALPPPRAPVAPTLSPEDERAALDAQHKATVAGLEKLLDISLKGKNLQPGQGVDLHLPVGDWAPQVLADVVEHYAALWSKAEIPKDKSGAYATDEHGRLTLTLTP